MLTLTPRLMAAVQLSKGAERIIDVGCDHGYLSAYLILEQGVCHAYACDINKGPLDNALQTAKEYKIEGKVTLRLCDGLQGLSQKDGDTVFICGMGGELIADILKAAPWTKNQGLRLILQPMSKSEKLREFLLTSGYLIENEVLAKEGDKLYCIMSAVGGIGQSAPHNLYLFSNEMKKDALFGEYVERLYSKYKAIVQGKKKALLPSAEEEEILSLLEEQNANR